MKSIEKDFFVDDMQIIIFHKRFDDIIELISSFQVFMGRKTFLYTITSNKITGISLRSEVQICLYVSFMRQY